MSPSSHGGQYGRLHPLQLCVRACREVQVNDVIGLAARGADAKIVFDFDDPMGAVHLRGLRRMRPGLPDRRADAQDHRDDGQRGGHHRRPRGELRLPLLRRRLPDHLQAAQGQETGKEFGSKAPADRPTKGVCASRGGSALTTSPIPTA